VIVVSVVLYNLFILVLNILVVGLAIPVLHRSPFSGWVSLQPVLGIPPVGWIPSAFHDPELTIYLAVVHGTFIILATSIGYLLSRIKRPRE
jgi:hypothetical protein